MLMLQAGVALSADNAAFSISRTDLVARPQPLIMGIGVHFGIGGDFNYVPQKTAALIQEMGFSSYRDDLAWPAYDQPGATAGNPQPKQLFDFMKLHAARPLLILGHSNSAVKDGNPPITEAGRKAFADFAARAAVAAKPFDPIYEIWNEWNLTAKFSLPFLVGPGAEGDPRAAMYYTALAKATVPAVAKAVPGSPLMVGAVGVDSGWQWTEAAVDAGAVAAPAQLSVHMYNQCEPDVGKRNATELIDRLGSLQTALSAKTGQAVPISVTEFGWPTAKQPCVISRQAAADYTAQFLLWSAAQPWVKGAWIYELKDQGRDQNNIEDNFGLFDYDYNPKPAACEVGQVIGMLRQAKSFKLSRPLPDVFVLAIDDGAGMKLATWTTSSETKANLTLAGGAVKAQPLCGSASGTASATVAIGPTPVIFSVSASSLSAKLSKH
jgi:hypothetical protein